MRFFAVLDGSFKKMRGAGGGISTMGIRFFDANRIESVREKINRDAEFRIASRLMSLDILVAADDKQCIFKVRDGVIIDILLNPSPMDAWSFFIKAPEKSWERFLMPAPPPFYHSLFGASVREDFQFGGDLEAMFAHYWATQRMFAVIRQFQNE
jgi:hypothetical protein